MAIKKNDYKINYSISPWLSDGICGFDIQGHTFFIVRHNSARRNTNEN